jgi:hypothetical protein
VAQEPSRSYGCKAKASIRITPHLAYNDGLAKVTNAFCRATFFPWQQGVVQVSNAEDHRGSQRRWLRETLPTGHGES